MSFNALAAVRDIEAPSSTALLVLYILAEYAGPDGACFPSQKLLAERSQLSLRTVRATLSQLRKAGLIGQQQRRRKDGSRTSDRTTLLFYSPEQAAETAACEIAKKPRKDREIMPGDKRHSLPPDQRRKPQTQAARGAGLSTFEPVTEQITLSAREPRSPVEAEAKSGLAGELVAVPAELRQAIVDDPRFGESWARSWLDPCLFDPAARTIHTRSTFARGRISKEIGALLRPQNVQLGEPVAQPARAAG